MIIFTLRTVWKLQMPNVYVGNEFRLKNEFLKQIAYKFKSEDEDNVLKSFKPE